MILLLFVCPNFQYFEKIKLNLLYSRKSNPLLTLEDYSSGQRLNWSQLVRSDFESKKSKA